MLNLEQQAQLAFAAAKSSEFQAMKQEELATILKNQGGKAALAGELIQQYALAAKSHALAAKSHVLAAQKNAPDSMQEYTLAGIERQQELGLHLKAIKEYALFVKNRTSRWQEFSEDSFK